MISRTTAMASYSNQQKDAFEQHVHEIDCKLIRYDGKNTIEHPGPGDLKALARLVAAYSEPGLGWEIELRTDNHRGFNQNILMFSGKDPKSAEPDDQPKAAPVELDPEVWERAFLQGQRSVYTEMFSRGLQGIGYDHDLDRLLERLIKEREATVKVLQEVCASYGDTDWAPEAYLADVIEKHLWRNLDKNAT